MSEAKIVLTAVDATKAAVESAKRNLAGLGEVASSLPARFGTIGLALAAAFQGATVKSAIDMLDRLDDMAEKSGIAASELSALRYAAEVAGTPLDSLAVGLRKLSVNMAAAAGGAQEQADAFKALGVDIKASDGSLKSSDRVLGELADRFASFRDSPEKAALAIAVFGKQGEAMIPLLNRGSAGIAELRDEAQRLGAVFSSEAAAAAGDFNDNLKRLELSFEASKVALATELLPSLNQLAEAFLEARESGSAVSLMGDGLRTALQTVVVVGSDVKFVLVGIGKEIGGIAAQIAALMRLDFDGFRAIGQAVTEDAARARAELDAYQRRVLMGASYAGAGRGTAADPRALGAVGSVREQAAAARGNAPVLPKGGSGAQETAALQFLSQLSKEYANSTGTGSKLAEVQEQLSVAGSKFTGEQKRQAVALAEAIDLQRRLTQNVEQAARAQQAQAEASERLTDAHHAAFDAIEQVVREQQFELSLVNQLPEAIEAARFAREQDNRERAVQAAITARALQEGWDEVRVLQERANATRALADARAAFDQRQGMLRRESYTAQGGVDAAVRDYNRDLARQGDAAREATTRTLGAMEDSLVDFVSTGKLSFRGLVDTIIAEFARLQVVRPLMAQLFGAGGVGARLMGSVFGGGGGSSAFGTINPDAGIDEVLASIGIMHTGGVVGRGAAGSRLVSMGLFDRAPRFHTGGIVGDEVPIIAKRGEGVFTPEQMRALGGGGRSASITFAPTVQVDSRTDQGQVSQAVQTALRNNNEQLLGYLRQQGVLVD